MCCKMWRFSFIIKSKEWNKVTVEYIPLYDILVSTGMPWKWQSSNTFRIGENIIIFDLMRYTLCFDDISAIYDEDNIRVYPEDRCKLIAQSCVIWPGCAS